MAAPGVLLHWRAFLTLSAPLAHGSLLFCSFAFLHVFLSIPALLTSRMDIGGGFEASGAKPLALEMFAGESRGRLLGWQNPDFTVRRADQQEFKLISFDFRTSLSGALQGVAGVSTVYLVHPTAGTGIRGGNLGPNAWLALNPYHTVL